MMHLRISDSREQPVQSAAAPGLPGVLMGHDTMSIDTPAALARDADAAAAETDALAAAVERREQLLVVLFSAAAVLFASLLAVAAGLR
jgi:hypothetical protein